MTSVEPVSKLRGSLASQDKALQTVDVLLNICGKSRWTTATQMLEELRIAGKKLIQHDANEMIIGNIVRRVIHIVREEFHAVLSEDATNSSSNNNNNNNNSNNKEMSEQKRGAMRPELVTFFAPAQIDFNKPMTPEQVKDFKARVTESIDNLKTEITNSNDAITEQADKHIHHNEVILVYGYSTTVYRFLTEAARKNLALGVFVAEGPDCSGHNMARALATSYPSKIQVTLIPDSSIFALMSRINMVVLGASAVLANGGLLAKSGVQMLALAAKQHAVPVIVCAGLHKLSPLFPSTRDSFNTLISPSYALPCSDIEIPPTLEVLNPVLDYVPPELIWLFITNSGTYNTAYIYKLLADIYSEADYHL